MGYFDYVRTPTRKRAEKYPFRMVSEAKTPDIKQITKELLDTLHETYPHFRRIKIDAYAVTADRGRAHLSKGQISVPVWCYGRERGKLIQYVAHEIAHVYAWQFEKCNNHGPDFQMWMKRICPCEHWHYEIEYKPKRAKAAGIVKPEINPTNRLTTSSTSETLAPLATGKPLQTLNPATARTAAHPKRVMKMTDNDFDFQIDEGVAIPTREIVGRPRGSQYPLEKMSQGQSFFLPLAGEEGATSTNKAGDVTELSVAEDLDRKMRQKQSYFSQLGKKLGISITTRTYDDGAEYNARYAGQAGLGVWHAGPRTEKDAVNDVEEDGVEIEA